MSDIIKNNNFHVLNEPMYRRNSTGNIRSYRYEYCTDDNYRHVCAHGVIVGDLNSPESSAILLGIGGATGVHSDTFVCIDDLCFVAAGDSVFALNVPSLKLEWSEKVDFATCFGVYWLSNHNRFVSWGECDICSLSKEGEKIWSFSGTDIFTEGFEINNETIKVVDFNGDEYTISVETGKEVQLSE
jgi:hypothetical protein